MRAPGFWRRDAASPWPALLAPAAALYDAAHRVHRASGRAESGPVPIFCVGAATVGGAGKTPTAIAMARRLLALGRHPDHAVLGGQLRDQTAAAGEGADDAGLAGVGQRAVDVRAHAREAGEVGVDELLRRLRRHTDVLR